jgi:hypothetical protein
MVDGTSSVSSQDIGDVVRDVRSGIEAQERKNRQIVWLATGLAIAIVVLSAAAYTRHEYFLLQQTRIAEVQEKVATERSIAALKALDRATPVVAVAPGARWSLSAKGWLLDADSPRKVRVTQSVAFAVFSKDGSKAFVQPAKGPLEAAVVVDLAAPGGAPHVIRRFDKAVRYTFAAFRPDGGVLTLLPEAGGLGVLDLMSGAYSSRAPSRSPLTFAMFSPDGGEYLIGAKNGAVSIVTFEPAHGASVPVKYLASFFSDSQLIGGAFSPDRSKVLLLFANSSAVVWDWRGSKTFDARFNSLTVGNN